MEERNDDGDVQEEENILFFCFVEGWEYTAAAVIVERERVSSSWPRSQRRRNAMILFVHIYL